MLTDHSHQLLKTAAVESVERIRMDRSKAPQRLKPLLAYIEEHLFDPTLDVNQLKRACGVRDNSVPIQFHSAVGRPPHGYIEDRRLETACRLLAKTDLKIWQISELLGYSSIQVFSRAFSRWSGQRPTLYRKKARRGEGGQELKSLGGGAFFDAVTLRRALAGELPSEEANLLIGRLLRLYPSCREALEEALGGSLADFDVSSDDDEGGLFGSASLSGDPQAHGGKRVAEAQMTGAELELLGTEEIVAHLERQTAERQQDLLEEMELTSPELFHQLCERSREIGVEEPQNAVQLAELAIRSLDLLEETVSDAALLSSLRAQGWIALADARRYASDERGAEQALADAELVYRSGDRKVEIEAEIALRKALLRRDQRRFDEAAELLEHTLTLHRQLKREEHIGELSAMLAAVFAERGDSASAIPHLAEAVRRAEEGPGKLELVQQLLTAYVDSDKPKEASELLPAAHQLAIAHGGSYHRNRLGWLKGVVQRDLDRLADAESTLLEARDAFAESDDAINAALVCLDVAELYRRQSRLSDLEKLSASMVSLFGSLHHHREALVALKLLHQAAEERRVSQMMLHNARGTLQSSQHLRASRRSRGL